MDIFFSIIKIVNNHKNTFEPKIYTSEGYSSTWGRTTTATIYSPVSSSSKKTGLSYPGGTTSHENI